MASSMKGFEHLEIQLEEIKSATNNFNEENVIGHGGFGKVYKGELSHSHSEGKGMVALKRLDRRHGQGDAEFYKEVRMLSCYRHENIISLLGFSRGRDEMILVYEYASRGSLDGYLKDVNLTWTQRLKICLDAAKGLSYLHDPRETYQRLIHCDIKSANILLDENFNAKVSDFGLSKIGPANQQNSILVTGALGTPGYCDPVFIDTYTLTKESDVYSFGVVLFEVLCGKLCVEYSTGQIKAIHVPMWKQSYEQKQLSGIVFQGLMEQMNQDSLETFSGIAYQCLKRVREERPAMSLVVEKLQEAHALQELHDLKPPKEYEEIVNAAVPPLNYRSLYELKALLTEGFRVNEGTTPLVLVTVVLKVHIHCEACAQEIRKQILEMKGVESAVPDLKSSQVTVKGTFATTVLDYVHKITGKTAVIVKHDPEPKTEDDKSAKDEKKDGDGEKKEEKKADEGDKPADSAAKLDDAMESAVLEMRKNEYYYYQPANFQLYPPRPAAESAYAYQMFSDENPNACSVM